MYRKKIYLVKKKGGHHWLQGEYGGELFRVANKHQVHKGVNKDRPVPVDVAVSTSLSRREQCGTGSLLLQDSCLQQGSPVCVCGGGGKHRFKVIFGYIVQD